MPTLNFKGKTAVEIYITGNDGWVYNDNLIQPQSKEWIGKEGEDAARHDKWWCMMYSRWRRPWAVYCRVAFIILRKNRINVEWIHSSSRGKDAIK